MAVVLGELLLDLGIDMSRYDEQILEAEQKAFSMATRIQSIMGGVKIDAPSLADELKLTPQVDDRQLTELNKHLELKRSHFSQVQRFFDRNPLTPKASGSFAKDFEQQLDQVQRTATANPIRVDADTSALDDVNEKLSAQREQKVTYRVRFDENTRQFRYNEGPQRGQFAPTSAGLSDQSKFINTKLDKVLDAIASVEKTSIKNTTQLKISIGRQGQKGIFERLFSAPQKIFDDIATGLLEGIGTSFALDASRGAQSYIEGKTGQSIYGLGRGAARFTYNRARGFGEIGAQALGYRGGLKDVQKDLDSIVQTFDDFLNPKKFANRVKALEDLLVGVLEDTTVYNNPTRAKQRVQDFFEPDLSAITEGAGRAAGVGIRAGAQPFRLRKRVELARSMELAKQIAEVLEVPDIEGAEDTQTINIQTGGVDFDEGRNTYFARNVLKNVLGPGVATVPVENVFSNSESFGNIFEAKKQIADAMRELFDIDIPDDIIEPIPLDRLINIAIEKGFNPDAISMEATRLAYEKKYPDKKFIFSGTSGGTAAAEEATAIAERGGATNVKGFGATLGLYGLTPTASQENFRAFVGDLDPLFYGTTGGRETDTSNIGKAQKKIFEASMDQFPIPAEYIPMMAGLFGPTKNTEVIEGTGIAHHLGQFMADPKTQAALSEFLGDYIQGIPKEFSGKQGTAAFKAYADIFAQFDALDRTFRVLLDDMDALDEMSQGKYAFVTPDNRLRKTYGDSQEFPDLQYAANEVEVSKRVKGVARDEVLAVQAVMQGLVETLNDVEDVDTAKIRELYGQLRDVFGAAPRTATEFAGTERDRITTLPSDIELATFAKESKEARAPRRQQLTLQQKESLENARTMAAELSKVIPDQIAAAIAGAMDGIGADIS
ncbi:MAG: hypothetical protein AAFU78_14560, partial [Cyanobacteria bacterium J06633_2]